MSLWIRTEMCLVSLFIAIFVIFRTFLVVDSRAFANNDGMNTTRLRHFIASNSIQRMVSDSEHINPMETSSAPDTNDMSRGLKRVFLSNRTVTCNDGSQAGFYLRKSSGSKKWVVFLEGGWHCYDIKSCRARWLRLRHLMTSAQWPETRSVGGILSAAPEENPYWHNANHVLVPYCSSDSWTGTRAEAETRDGWKFMGALIVRQVIADLIPLGLGRATGSELLLVGSSAGALGVMLNVDRVRSFLHKERNIKVSVKGVSDSGWFLDREPYTPGAVAAYEGVKLGWKMWKGALPEACVKKHMDEPWRCYFGYRLYPTLKSPLFVFQWLFDEAQIRADSVGAPVTPQQWDYIHAMGGALRASLDNVTAVFAPSCIGHSVLTKRDWLNVKIDDISLSEALRCWERSTGRKRDKARRSSGTNIRKGNENKRLRHSQEQKWNNEKRNNTDSTKKRLTKEERQQRRRHNEHKRMQKKLRESQKSQRRNTGNTNFLPENRRNAERTHNRRRKNSTAVHNHRNSSNQNQAKRRKQHQKDQPPRSNLVPLSDGRVVEPKSCSLRLLERCSWPQCNHSCPTLTNPLTGEEMKFLELLTSFGLDIEAVAAALGVDMQTLNNMDHAELVNLLTQQVS